MTDVSLYGRRIPVWDIIRMSRLTSNEKRLLRSRVPENERRFLPVREWTVVPALTMSFWLELKEGNESETLTMKSATVPTEALIAARELIADNLDATTHAERRMLELRVKGILESPPVLEVAIELAKSVKAEQVRVMGDILDAKMRLPKWLVLPPANTYGRVGTRVK